MPTDDEHTASGAVDDPELKQLQTELALETALAPLLAELARLGSKLKQLDALGLGPARALDIHKRYYQREKEKTEIQITLLKLPKDIEERQRAYEYSKSEGARREHERRCQMIQAGRAMGRSKDTYLPPSPETEAKTRLAAVLESFKSKQQKLRELTGHDAEWTELVRSVPAPRRLVTQALPPVTEIAGRGRIPAPPKAAEVPREFPPDYPPSLKLRTSVILAEAVKEFPEPSRLEQLCKSIVSRLTELFCAAVHEGAIQAYAAPDRLNQLLHYVRVANCKDANERFDVETTVINSDEWHAMIVQLADCERTEPEGDSGAKPGSRRIEQSVADEEGKSKKQEDQTATPSLEPSVTDVAPGTAEMRVLVDTFATPADGARRAKVALRKKGLPYRSVKDYGRIVQAVEYKKKHGCTFVQASEAIFRDKSWASKIAYHYRKLRLGEQ